MKGTRFKAAKDQGEWGAECAEHQSPGDVGGQVETRDGRGHGEFHQGVFI